MDTGSAQSKPGARAADAGITPDGTRRRIDFEDEGEGAKGAFEGAPKATEDPKPEEKKSKKDKRRSKRGPAERNSETPIRPTTKEKVSKTKLEELREEALEMCDVKDPEELERRMKALEERMNEQRMQLNRHTRDIQGMKKIAALALTGTIETQRKYCSKGMVFKGLIGQTEDDRTQEVIQLCTNAGVNCDPMARNFKGCNSLNAFGKMMRITEAVFRIRSTQYWAFQQLLQYGKIQHRGLTAIPMMTKLDLLRQKPFKVAVKLISDFHPDFMMKQFWPNLALQNVKDEVWLIANKVTGEVMLEMMFDESQVCVMAVCPQWCGELKESFSGKWNEKFNRDDWADTLDDYPFEVQIVPSPFLEAREWGQQGGKKGEKGKDAKGDGKGKNLKGGKQVPPGTQFLSRPPFATRSDATPAQSASVGANPFVFF